MKTFIEKIWEPGEYNYAAAYGFEPNIHGFIHEDGVRDCMLVVPGGGYCMCVPPEAEIVAKSFYDRGMNAFVLTYTTDITMSVPLKKQPLNDISRAVRFIRKNAENAKVAVRNIRRDAMDAIKKLGKSSEISEDEEKTIEDEIQKATDKRIAEIDKMADAKEKEIMTV